MPSHPVLSYTRHSLMLSNVREGRRATRPAIRMCAAHLSLRKRIHVWRNAGLSGRPDSSYDQIWPTHRAASRARTHSIKRDRGNLPIFERLPQVATPRARPPMLRFPGIVSLHECTGATWRCSYDQSVA